jgi:TPR repeat protein
MISWQTTVFGAAVVLTIGVLLNGKNIDWFLPKGAIGSAPGADVSSMDVSDLLIALNDRWQSKAALTQLTRLAANDTSAKKALAKTMFFGTNHVLPDYPRAFQLYQEVHAATGDAEAATMLALYYSEGLGVAVDAGRSLALHLMAAQDGSLASHMVLATWYSGGLHVKANCPVARRHFFAVAGRVEGELAGRRRKYRSMVPPESIVDPKRHEDVMAMFPSPDLIEYYQYSADRGQVESQVNHSTGC